MNVEDQPGFALHFSRERGHGGGDLRADAAFEIRAVVHVLDRKRRKSRVAEDARLGQRLLNQHLD